MFMQYNEDLAKKAGGSDFISDGGPHICVITDCVYIESGAKQTKGLQFSVQTKEGLKGNYLTVYYEKADGTQVGGGMSVLNAIMGITGAKQLSFKQVNRGTVTLNEVPEFIGKGCGMFLQKVLYSKNDGTDGYKFDIRTPFHPQTGKTLKELAENKDAKTIERMHSSYKDQDDRKQGQPNNTQSAPSQSSDDAMDAYFNNM